MSELETLERTLLAEIDAAADEGAIEAVRVGALGKKGSISELLKTLGSMSPEERQTRGARINALKNTVTEAISARKTALKDAAIAERLARETVDISLPVRSSPAERGRIHPISQIVDEITRSSATWFLDCRGTGYRDRLLQLHRAELPRRASGPRDARHLLLRARREG